MQEIDEIEMEYKHTLCTSGGIHSHMRELKSVHAIIRSTQLKASITRSILSGRGPLNASVCARCLFFRGLERSGPMTLGYEPSAP